MIRSVSRLFLAVLLPLASLAAQESMSLSVDEAIRIAFDKSKALHASEMKVQYADARSGEARTALLPTLKFGGAYTRLSNVPSFTVSLPLPPPAPRSFTLAPAILDNYNLHLTLQQPLFTGWKIRSAVNAAEYSANATQKDYDKDRNDLIYNTKLAYWNLSKASELATVVSDNVEQIKAHLKDVQNLHTQGLATRNDVLKVQVQLSEAQLRQIDAQNAVRLGMIALNNTIGLPLDTEVSLTSTLDHLPKASEPLPALINRALERRAEIKGMEFRVKAGEAGLAQARSGWFPQFYLTGDYYYNRPNQRYQPLTDAFKDSWDIGVAVSFDIWNWGATVRQTDAAAAQLAQAQDGLDQMRDGVTLDVTSNYLNLKRAVEKITVAEQGVRQAEESYRVTRSRFQQGLSTNTDLLDAEVALLQAKTNRTQARTDYELAEAGLERAIGE